MGHVMRNQFMEYANNKGADQPAHTRSLISAFVIRCLDSMIPLVSISKILSIYLASVAAQPGLGLTWSPTPKTVAEQAGWSLTWRETPKTGFLVTRLKSCL